MTPSMAKTENEPRRLRVTEALSKDVGRAYARMGPEDLETLGVSIGDAVEVLGKKRTVARAMPAYKDLRGQSRIQLDGLTRENAGAGLDEYVSASYDGLPVDRLQACLLDELAVVL